MREGRGARGERGGGQTDNRRQAAPLPPNPELWLGLGPCGMISAEVLRAIGYAGLASSKEGGKEGDTPCPTSVTRAGSFAADMPATLPAIFAAWTASPTQIMTVKRRETVRVRTSHLSGTPSHAHAFLPPFLASWHMWELEHE